MVKNEDGDGNSRDAEPVARDFVRSSEFQLHDPSLRWEQPIGRLPSLPQFLKPVRSNVDPERWAIDLSVREYELPSQLYVDLRERTPQALLRDLFRPAKQFFAELEHPESPLGALHGELYRVRDARRLEPVPIVEPSVEVVADEKRKRDARMAEPWRPHKADDAPRDDLKIWAHQYEEEPTYKPE